MAYQGVLMGMGNPLLDISATVPQEVLDKYEVKLDSAILAEEKHIPIYQELVESYSPDYIAGGATQNSIRVAQWMIGEAGQTAFMGSIGEDKFGEQLRESATSDGVLTHYFVDKDTPTGTCAVLVKEGERSLIANLAAANNFKPEHLETDKAKEIVASSKVYYSAGFFLTVSVESLTTVAKQFTEENKIFCLNFAAPFIIDFFADQVATALSYADFVFANESEAAAYGKKHELGDDIEKIALAVAASPKVSGTRPRTVVFTQGADATVVAYMGVVTRYEVEKLPKELLVDTNGAGDAFVGGFLSQLVKEENMVNTDLKACVEAGHWAARQIIQRSGCTFPTGECPYKP